MFLRGNNVGNMEKKLDILITGGTGFIGSHLVRRFSNLGHRVTVVTRTEKLERINRITHAPKLKLIEADISDFTELNRKINNFRFDIIFHFAAQLPRNENKSQFDRYIKTNAEGTLNILKLSDALKVYKIVYASSVSVYSPTQNDVIDENYPTIPDNVYGISKLIGEIYCRMYALEREINIIVLRLSGIFGPGRTNGSEYKFIKKIMKD